MFADRLAASSAVTLRHGMRRIYAESAGDFALIEGIEEVDPFGPLAVADLRAAGPPSQPHRISQASSDLSMASEP